MSAVREIEKIWGLQPSVQPGDFVVRHDDGEIYEVIERAGELYWCSRHTSAVAHLCWLASKDFERADQ